jgi:hypothetical protein
MTYQMDAQTAESLYESGYADALENAAKALEAVSSILGPGAKSVVCQLFRDEAKKRRERSDSNVPTQPDDRSPESQDDSNSQS